LLTKVSNTSNSAVSIKNSDLPVRQSSNFDQILNSSILKLENNERLKKLNNDLRMKPNVTYDHTFNNTISRNYERSNRSNSVVSIKSGDLGMKLNPNYDKILNSLINIKENTERPRRTTSVVSVKNSDFKMESNSIYDQIINKAINKIENNKKLNQLSTTNLSDLQKCKLLKEIDQYKRLTTNLTKLKNSSFLLKNESKLNQAKNFDNLSFLESITKHEKKAEEKSKETESKRSNVSFYDFLYDASEISKNENHQISSANGKENITQEIFSSVKENETHKLVNESKISCAVKSTTTIEDSNETKGPMLGLKVFACGMCKGGKLPIPKENFFIEKGNFGDDAGFHAENSVADAIGN
jgi:hypothetical protein